MHRTTLNYNPVGIYRFLLDTFDFHGFQLTKKLLLFATVYIFNLQQFDTKQSIFVKLHTGYLALELTRQVQGKQPHNRIICTMRHSISQLFSAYVWKYLKTSALVSGIDFLTLPDSSILPLLGQLSSRGNSYPKTQRTFELGSRYILNLEMTLYFSFFRLYSGLALYLKLLQQFQPVCSCSCDS